MHVKEFLLVRLKGEYLESKALSQTAMLFLVDNDFSQNIFFFYLSHLPTHALNSCISQNSNSESFGHNPGASYLMTRVAKRPEFLGIVR